MKNKRIEHASEEVKIYRDYYKPSFNVFRFFRSIFGVLLFGSTSVAHSYARLERRKISR
jgi:hypothetical protein